MNNFSTNIKKIRELHGLSQNELAQILCVSRKTISSWENQRNVPDINMIIIISQKFNINIYTLISHKIENKYFVKKDMSSPLIGYVGIVELVLVILEILTILNIANFFLNTFLLVINTIFMRFFSNYKFYLSRRSINRIIEYILYISIFTFFILISSNNILINVNYIDKNFLLGKLLSKFFLCTLLSYSSKVLYEFTTVLFSKGKR